MRKVKVHAEVSGTVTTIRTEGPTKNAWPAIAVPEHRISTRACGLGTFGIAGIEGNKDISLTAGDLKIDVLPASYAHVHASVTIGDVRLSPGCLQRRLPKPPIER